MADAPYSFDFLQQVIDCHFGGKTWIMIQWTASTEGVTLVVSGDISATLDPESGGGGPPGPTPDLPLSGKAPKFLLTFSGQVDGDNRQPIGWWLPAKPKGFFNLTANLPGGSDELFAFVNTAIAGPPGGATTGTVTQVTNWAEPLFGVGPSTARFGYDFTDPKNPTIEQFS